MLYPCGRTTSGVQMNSAALSSPTQYASFLMSVHLGGLQYGEEGLKASANGGGPGRGPGGGGGGGGGGGFHFQVLTQALEDQGDFLSTREVLCINVSITYHFWGSSCRC